MHQSGSSSKEVSEEIYHRIYRLIKRRVNAHTIAATLHLPVRTVLGVINRLERAESTASDQAEESSVSKEGTAPADTDYLDIYFYPKTRYAILDLVGALSDNNAGLLKTELEKVFATSWKALAIRMSNVQQVSTAAIDVLLAGREEFLKLGRFIGLLDPASSIELTLASSNIESAIPIFGTERAFEDAAFAKKGKLYSRHSGNSAS